MVMMHVLHMNSGDGESSYANNSFLQETVIRKTLPILKRTIKGISKTNLIFGGQCFNIADMGCSSGKNTLLVASNIINIVNEICTESNHKSPQFQICLNDLFRNDFNNIFKMLPDFYEKFRKEKGESFGPCFVSGVPGSFYGRLFPDTSLHFVHSSYSLHWLSKVPEGLENNGLNIYMARTSPQNVFEAYGNQFHADFTKFLQMRSEEIVHGGCMVLTFIGRSTTDLTSDDSGIIWELLAESLFDMLTEGLVQESDISSFNIPNYFPCEDEVKSIIQTQGSFSLDNLNVFEVNWDPRDTDYKNMKDSNEASHSHGKNTANLVRAVAEPLLTSHFGNSIIEMLFKKYEKHATNHLAMTKTRFYNVVVSLSRK